MPGSDLLLDTQHTFSARQEALWADAKIDGRVVFSIRETYKLHRERLIAIQRDVEMLRWLVKGCKGSLVRRHQERKNDASAHEDSCRNDCNVGESMTQNSKAPLVTTNKSTTEYKGECADQGAGESPLYHFFNGLIPDVFCRVAEHYGQNYGEIIKFIASWPVYNSQVLPAVENKAFGSRGINIYVRKRPLLTAEEAENEWDVVSLPERNTLTVHEGRVAQNGRRLALHLAHYTADAVLSSSDNESAYNRNLANLAPKICFGLVCSHARAYSRI